jgi:hypothetical protein
MAWRHGAMSPPTSTRTRLEGIPEISPPISPSTGPKDELSPASIHRSLWHWTLDADHMSNCALREQRNPFPGVDMNEGENRARFSAQLLPDPADLLEDKMRVVESFKGFSLWRQVAPLQLSISQWEGLLEEVFEAEYTGWSRAPGSWWARRKKVFSGEDMRGLPFLEWVESLVEDIQGATREWWDHGIAGTNWSNPLKRKAGKRYQKDDVGPPPQKRLKELNRASEQVMSEEWRRRRRGQEKRAGRWTDGTLRMDRMWAEFHWVLPTGDPGDNIWDRPNKGGVEITQVSGSDIFGKGY